MITERNALPIVENDIVLNLLIFNTLSGVTLSYENSIKHYIFIIQYHVEYKCFIALYKRAE